MGDNNYQYLIITEDGMVYKTNNAEIAGEHIDSGVSKVIDTFIMMRVTDEGFEEIEEIV